MKLSQVLAVARNTFTESIRQPISMVLLLLALGVLSLNPAISSYTLEDDDALLRDIGLSTIFVAGLFLSAFTAAGALSVEIRRKTVLSVVSKPISRPTFIVGKYFGALAAVAIAQFLWSLALLFTLRHGTLMTVREPYHEPVIFFGLGALVLATVLSSVGNYLRGYNFASSFLYSLSILLSIAMVPAFMYDAKWNRVEFWSQFDPQLLLAIFLIAQALAILCAIAVAVATRLGQMTTLTICTIIFLAGLTAEYFIGPYVDHSGSARAIYAALPNLQYLWLGEALLEGRRVSGLYVIMTTCYSGLYVAAILGIATALFQTRDVG